MESFTKVQAFCSTVCFFSRSNLNTFKQAYIKGKITKLIFLANISNKATRLLSAYQTWQCSSATTLRETQLRWVNLDCHSLWNKRLWKHTVFVHYCNAKDSHYSRSQYLGLYLKVVMLECLWKWWFWNGKSMLRANMMPYTLKLCSEYGNKYWSQKWC